MVWAKALSIWDVGQIFAGKMSEGRRDQWDRRTVGMKLCRDDYGGGGGRSGGGNWEW